MIWQIKNNNKTDHIQATTLFIYPLIMSDSKMAFTRVLKYGTFMQYIYTKEHQMTHNDKKFSFIGFM